MSDWKPTHRHYKGGLYRVIAEGRIEADLTPAVIYESEAGEVWVLPKANFDGLVQPIVTEDGIGMWVPRFEPLPAAPTAPPSHPSGNSSP